jgi:hypothetical protein
MPIVDSNNTTDNDNAIVILRDEVTSLDARIIKDNDGIDKLQVKSSNVPQPIGNLFFQHALNGGSDDMNVDGSVTPVVFEIPADATRDIVVEALAFESFANGIKIDKFLSINSPLTNGITIEIKSEDTVFSFLSIQNTNEFDSHFSFGPGRSYRLTFASGNDAMVARFAPQSPFVLMKSGSYATDDYIRVSINDDISSINKLSFLAFGAFEI